MDIYYNKSLLVPKGENASDICHYIRWMGIPGFESMY